MDHMLYVAMAGAKQTLMAQAVNSHNLANASTTGFKAELFQARSMPVFGEVHPSRVYTMTERPGVDFRPGSIQYTGRELDLAINGEGWIAVQAPDGSEGYTRAGDLRTNVNGLLETGAGEHLVAFEELVSGRLPFDRKRLFALAETLAGRQQQDNYLLFCELLQDWIMTQARASALSGAGTVAAAAGWSTLGAEVGRSSSKANALNLDRRSVLLDAFRRIEQVRRAQIPI